MTDETLEQAAKMTGIEIAVEGEGLRGLKLRDVAIQEILETFRPREAALLARIAELEKQLQGVGRSAHQLFIDQEER